MSSPPTPPEPGSAPHQQLPSDAYDSGIIETAEEVEVPDLSLEPRVEARATETSETAEPDVAVEPPASLPPPAEPLEPRFASARSELPPPNSASPTPLTAEPTAGPSWSSLFQAQREHGASPLLQRSTAIARRYPALWLVAAPVGLAALLVLLAAASGPQPRAESKHSAPAPRTALPAATANSQPAALPAAPAPVDVPVVTVLEAREPTTLSVDELLLLNSSRTQSQRADAKALAQKLRARPELIEDSSVQSDLRRFAAAPATAPDALAAMALAPSPIGPDLLFEVWASRSSAPVTAELARALLYSREVRSSASPALAVALDLRSADSCEALQAALPRARSEGDTRALAPLVKLTYRRGCGTAQRDDCHPCLRSSPKELPATIKAANSRRAPRYPSAKTK